LLLCGVTMATAVGLTTPTTPSLPVLLPFSGDEGCPGEWTKYTPLTRTDIMTDTGAELWTRTHTWTRAPSRHAIMTWLLRTITLVQAYTHEAVVRATGSGFMVQPSAFAVASTINTNPAPVSPLQPFRLYSCGLPMINHNYICWLPHHSRIRALLYYSLCGHLIRKDSKAEDMHPLDTEAQ